MPKTFKDTYGISETVVKCTNCGEIFDEAEIEIEPVSEEEICPKCREKGCLMDIA